jgi:rare lipoprotein A
MRRIFSILIFLSIHWLVLANEEDDALDYGMASVYSATFQGKRTASGEIFNHKELTAAHQKFRFGTLVKITRLDNGRSVVVRINDRGPFVSQRITDLSKAAAQQLGIQNDKEEIRVKMEVVSHKNLEIGTSTTQEPKPKPFHPLNHDRSRPVREQEQEQVTSKGVEENAVLKEYRYMPNTQNSIARPPATAQKKNSRL